jgi:hypothetical protein
VFRRIAAMTDPMSIVLATHLFTEHWINQILLKFCPHSDLTDFTYSKKLLIAFSIGKLPDKLFENLKKLNKLRNEIAHRLDFDFTKMDLNYHPTRKEFSVADYKPSYSESAAQHYICNVIRGVFCDTYLWLHDHCVKELGFTGESATKHSKKIAAK